MRPVQDGTDDVGLDLKQADPSQIGRTSRSAITPACTSPSADSPQESRPAAETAGEAPVDDSDEWDYDPFIDPDADPEPDDVAPVDAVGVEHRDRNLVPVTQGAFHGPRGDLVGLDDEGLEQGGDQEDDC